MIFKPLPIFIFLFFIPSLFWGQISPGDLTKAHSDLEGLRNCTLCHDLGNKVSSNKCLDCHNEIQSLIIADKGYHAHPSVRKQDCFACHSEHHGRNFDMVRFDQDNFKHNLTGYELEGQHNIIDCRACHLPDNISDREIQKREGTFLGLEQECLTCHNDFHQNTLSSDCIRCHGFDEWRPAPGFDHDEADFVLKGEHILVDCKECHPMSFRKGREFQQFTDIPFQSCIDCHDDPHNDQIPGACSQCHVESSFADFMGQEKFDHNQTKFTLKGSHKRTNCFACHTDSNLPETVFQDRWNVDENNCMACHKDVHKGKFGENCAKCHNERSFLALNNMDFFDHRLTDYPLEGKHQGVDCKACHKQRFTKPIDFSQCKNCHSDYHRGDFTKKGRTPDCVECHSLFKGFEYSMYTLEQHQKSDFPLLGAHFATPCFACHMSEADNRWRFKYLGESCSDCHENIHEGYISAKYYPGNSCESCHNNESWASISFDHKLTDWPLDGQHGDLDCRNCHFDESNTSNSFVQKFNSLDGNCVSCHENVHGDEYAVNGLTDCTRCHITEHWYPQDFDHDQTRFPLDGRHAEIACNSCHELISEDGSTDVLFKLNKLQCVDCHQ